MLLLDISSSYALGKIFSFAFLLFAIDFLPPSPSEEETPMPSENENDIESDVLKGSRSDEETVKQPKGVHGRGLQL